MALMKEPYGLVYNTDGTLCTTYRDDEVPFRGVRSFAVETATTNLLGNTVFDTAIFTGTGMGRGTILNHLPGKGLYGSMLTRATKSDNMTESYISAARGIQAFFIPQVGKTYTYSVYARLYGKQSNQPFLLHYYDGKHYPSINVGLLTPEWKRYSYTFTVRPEYTGGTFNIYNWLPHSSVEVGSGFEICLPQVEQKPFASSFVVGSRPNGRLVIPVEDLKFDIANDDWVISYWKYPVATDNDLLTDWNETTIGDYGNYGGIWWGRTNDNRFHISYNSELGTKITTKSASTDPNLYFRHWHHEVAIKNSNLLQYWVDGVLQCQLTISPALNTNFVTGLRVGAVSTGNPSNSYIANLCYGLYTDQWTDEYIREVYEAKIPFPVQSQLSIY